MEAVTAGDEAALDGSRRTVGVLVAHHGVALSEVLQGDARGLVAQVAALAEEDLGQVAHQDLLRAVQALGVVLVHVDRHRVAVEVEAILAERDRLTRQDLLQTPFAEQAYPEGVDRSGSLALLDVGARVLLQHDAVDAVAQAGSNAQDLWISLGLACEGRTFPNDPVMVIE
jgi:hypothetical protein